MRFSSLASHGFVRLSFSLACTLAACGDSGGPKSSGHFLGEDPSDAGGPGSPSDAGAEGEPMPLVCEATLPTACPEPKPTFKQDVLPIIKQRCSACHDGRGEQWPLVDYSHVSDWYDLIRTQISQCTMPPPDAGVEMPTSERETILEWIRCGVPE